MNSKIISIAILSAFLINSSTGATDKIVCYLGSWANYRLGNGQFTIEHIDPYICTHVIYSFVGINADGSIRIMDDWLDIQLGAIRRLNDLKKINPKLKTLVAIGGANEGTQKFSTVVTNSDIRAAFVNNAISFVNTHGFDGFDLDWEYPVVGGRPSDKANFGILCQELREAFDKQNPRLILTAAVHATQAGIDTSYDVPMLAKHLDFINIMTYDLHGPWDYFTGHNAPLYAHPSETTPYSQQLNVDACISAWINAGTPPEKVVLGMGTYGHSFTLANPSHNGIGAPVLGAGQHGKYSQQSGMLGYNEICEQFMEGGWNIIWEGNQQVPYAYKGNQWVGYDDVKSITIKSEYAISRGLGGLMIWSIDTDDFRGICGTKYPLLQAINRAIGNSLPLPSLTTKVPAESSTTTTTTTTTTISPPSTPTTQASSPNPGSNDSLCVQEGYIRDPTNCGKFYYCVPKESTFTVAVYNCPKGLYFDINIIACNYPSLVECSV